MHTLANDTFVSVKHLGLQDLTPTWHGTLHPVSLEISERIIQKNKMYKIQIISRNKHNYASQLE